MAKKPKDFSTIIQRIDEAESWRDGRMRDKWEEWLKLYKSKSEPREGSNIFVPHTFMQCEVVKARVGGAIFANRPYVSMFARSGEDAAKAKAAEVLIDWQFNERMDLPGVFTGEVLHDAVVLGTAITYTGWKKEVLMVKDVEPVSEMLVGEDGEYIIDPTTHFPMLTFFDKEIQRPEVVYDDPIVQRIDLFDFFVDRQAASIADARFCGHTEYLTRGAIEALEEEAGWEVEWKDLSPATEITGGKEIRQSINDLHLADGRSGIESSEDSWGKEDKGSIYKVRHYWENNRHVVVVGDNVCALDEENPFWHGKKPYDKVCYIMTPGEFYGIGIPEVLRDLQKELNTVRNQRIDYNSMSLRRMWKMRKGCGLTPKDLRWRQNGVVQLEEMDDIQEIDVQSLPASAFSNEEIIKQDMKDATGCHDIIMGLADADETATTTMTKDNNASIRFEFFIKAVVRDMLLPIVKKCLVMNKQFLEDERIIRVTGDADSGFLAVSADDLLRDYDIEYMGSAIEPMANKELYKQKVMEAYNLAMGNPLVQQDPNAMLSWLRELASALEIKDVDGKMPQVVQPQPEVAAMPAPEMGMMLGGI